MGGGPIGEFPRFLSLATGWIPFSLAEFVVALVVGRQVVGLVGGVREYRGRVDAPGRLALRGGLRFAQDLGILLFLFYLLWGIHYARPGVEDRLDLPQRGPVPTEELRELAEVLVERTNALYLEVHGTPDLGGPTPRPALDSLLPELEAAWEKAREGWGLRNRVARPHGAPKVFLLTPLVRPFQIAGMYFPYTGEALVMADLPGAQLPKDLAHEMAHQRGTARESDANVLAYLVTIGAEDPRIRYSGTLFLQRQFLATLIPLDPEGAATLIESRYPGVQRDVDAIREYWLRSRGPVGEASTRMNDAMLRSHGIPEGVASYGGSVWVVAALARREGIEAVTAPLRLPPPAPNER